MTIVIAEHVSDTSALDSLYISALRLGAWIQHSGGILQSGANVRRVAVGFDVTRAHTGVSLEKGSCRFFLQILLTCEDTNEDTNTDLKEMTY